MSAIRQAHLVSDTGVTQMQYFRSYIAAAPRDEQWLLETGQLTARAFSCLLLPQVGDLVLYAQDPVGNSHILAVLERINPNSTPHHLNLPHTQNIALTADKLALLAKTELSLDSGQDIQVNAPAGCIRLLAKDLFQTIGQSLIQLCKNCIQRSEQHDISAQQLLKTHARHQINTADKEIRLDAERINMG